MSILLAAFLVASPGESDDIGSLFTVADGLEVTLWAESPQLFNPTAMDVDERGRIWVTETVNYRRWGGRNPGREHPNGERVVILEDTDGDGRADSSKVFVEDTELVSPLGIAVLGNKVYVSASPHLYVYTDEDGDDVADSREILLTGFGGYDHDHGLHSVVFAPDGSLVVAVGNAGPHIVTDRSGWTLRSGSIYNGGGPTTADNKPGLVSDDGRAWTGGLILRMQPDGTGLEVLAHNFRNNYEVAVDAEGNLWQSDNDDDGNQGCRALLCMEGGNHGFFSADGKRTWQFDRRPGQTTQDAHWHQEDPGVVPAGLITGAGGPTGVAVYSSGYGLCVKGDCARVALGEHLLVADAGARIVRMLPMLERPREASAKRLEDGVLIEPSPDATGERGAWFRPSDVAVGPHGEIYIADWYDPGVGGHLAGDREAYGRILVVSRKGWDPARSHAVVGPGETSPGKPAKSNGARLGRPTRGIDTMPIPQAIDRLSSPIGSHRYEAWNTLMEAGEDAVPAIERSLAGLAFYGEGPRQIFALARLGPKGVASVTGILDEALGLAGAEFHVRDAVAAWRALRSAGVDVVPIAEKYLLGSEENLITRFDYARLRREIALSLRDVEAERAIPLLVELAVLYDGADRHYLEAIGIGADGKEEALYAELAAALGDVPAEWDARFEGLAWRLHQPAAIPAFAARAAARSLPEDARRRAIDALAFIPTREAANAVLELALSGPEDLRSYARWWIEHRDTNDWRPFRMLDELPPSGLEKAELLWSSGVVREGSVEIDVPIGNTERIWLVATDASNGNACDWVAWIEPELVPDVGRSLDLTTRAWSSASAAWGNTNVGENAVGGPISVDGQTFDVGIGTHAHSEISWDVPRGYARLRATAAVDDGGKSQPNSPTSVEFKVYVERGSDEIRLRGLRIQLEASAMPERLVAARELAKDPEGGLLLVHLAEKGQLPPPVMFEVADHIFSNPNLAVRALAGEYFGRPDDSMPPVAELLAMEGDARRGEQLFYGEKAGCHQCHSLQRGPAIGGAAIHPRGGDVGPDLTNVRSKLARPELFDAILNPSAAIAFGYDTWVVEMSDGRLYSGFMLADGAQIVIEDTQGIRHVLDANEVNDLYKQPLSIMPQGLAAAFEPQDLVDLVAFLQEDPERQPTYGETIELFDGESLDGWTYYLTDDGAEMSDVWSVEDGVLTCEGDPIGYLRTEADYTNFVLELEWRFLPERGPGNSGVLMRMHGADKVWPRSIEAQLHHRNAGDIWNIGEFPMSTDPTRTNGRHTSRRSTSTEKPLGEWNRYRITLDRGRLVMEVNGVVQNTAEWCAEIPGKICLQSEGAAIQFRNIRLTPILD